jgi:acetyl esterase
MAQSHVVAFVVLSGCAVVGCTRSRDADRRENEKVPPSLTQVDDARRPEATPAPKVTEVKPQPEDALKGVDKDMAEVLVELQMVGAKPIETLSVAEARKQPTPADAVKAVLSKHGRPTEPEAVAKVQDRTLPSPAGAIPVRVYTPAGTGPMPVIVYFHGGGFVIASNDVYDATARALANGAKAIVVAVEYRKAPEHKFPAAHDDAFAAYGWVLKNGASLGGDPKRVAVAGESAGGNLAANVAIMARDQREQYPTHVLLIYPIASSSTSSESYAKYADARPLNKAMMGWFTGHYFRSPADARDPRINLVAAKLIGLPETTIINAEIDPLLSDGEELAKKLKEAEVPVKQKTYGGVTHEFFGMGATVADAKDAMELACDRLKASFAAPKRDVTADATRP